MVTGEFRDLVEKCLEGSATAEEMERVEDAVASDPACAAWLDGAVTLDGHLRAATRDRSSFVLKFMERITHGTHRAAFAVRAVRRLRKERVGARRVRRRASGFVVALATAAVLLAAVYVGGAFDTPEQASTVAELTSVRGTVNVANGKDIRQIRRTALVRPGHRVVTEEDAEAILRYPDGSTLTLGERTALTLADRVTAKEMMLRKGTIVADVAPQPADAPMSITTTTAAMTVLGTKFTLSFDALMSPSLATRLEVESGRVDISTIGGTRSVTVATGQYAIAGSGFELEARPLKLDMTGFRLTFDEEFDDLSVTSRGPNGPGGSRWIAHTPYWGDYGEARFADPHPGYPFTTDHGMLRIQARRDERGTWSTGFLSSVDTKGRGFAQAYGYFECRMRLPGGKATWPAFWIKGGEELRRKDGPLRTVPVYVIAEHHGAEGNRIHTEWQVYTPEGPGPKMDVSHAVPDVTDDFHTYGCLVEPDRVSWYYDRTELRSVPAPDGNDEPKYILVNLAMGGGWPLDDDTPDPAHMFVDYVKVYALPDVE